MWELACGLNARSAGSIPKTPSLFGAAKNKPTDQFPFPPLPPDDESDKNSLSGGMSIREKGLVCQGKSVATYGGSGLSC